MKNSILMKINSWNTFSWRLHEVPNPIQQTACLSLNIISRISAAFDLFHKINQTTMITDGKLVYFSSTSHTAVGAYIG